jgi:hypothetical protein
MKQNTCPCCGGELTEQSGDQIHCGDRSFGVTLFCRSRSCPAQEVSGHGNNAKDAYSVIQDKFVRRENRE